MNREHRDNYDLSVALPTIPFEQVLSITKRDLDEPYYLLDSWNSKYREHKHCTAILVNGIPLGYALVAINADSSRKIGEVELVHITPEVRCLGLGTLILAQEHIQLIEQNPDQIKIEQADRTGMIKNFAMMNGFKSVAHSDNEYPTYILEKSQFNTALPSLLSLYGTTQSHLYDHHVRKRIQDVVFYFSHTYETED